MTEHPVTQAIERIVAEQNRRYAWLSDFAAKIRTWREEDRRNGIVWSDGK